MRDKFVVLKKLRSLNGHFRRKKDFFHTEMNLVNGIQKIKGQNCGIYLTEEKTMENTLEFFQFLIGQKWMCGNT